MVSTIYPSPSVELMRRALWVIFCMALFFYECKVYDLASAAFVAVGLGLMARGDWMGYGVAFAFGSINRETMGLLLLVFMLHSWRHMSGRMWMAVFVYQAFLFLTVRICLMMIFASAPGAAFWLRPWENVLFFAQFPWLCGLHWVALGFVMWCCVRRWNQQPRLLRSAFVVMMPALMVLYLVFGWAFEVRVFAELYPVVFAMMNAEW